MEVFCSFCLIWNVWLGIPQFMQKDCVALDMVVFTACCGGSGVVSLALGCATMFTSSKVLVVWSLKLCHKHLLGWQLSFSIDWMDYHHSSCTVIIACYVNQGIIIYFCGNAPANNRVICFAGSWPVSLAPLACYTYIHLHTYMYNMCIFKCAFIVSTCCE